MILELKEQSNTFLPSSIKLQMDQAKSLQEAYPGPSPSIITKHHKDSWGMGGNFGGILGGVLRGILGRIVLYSEQG